MRSAAVEVEEEATEEPVEEETVDYSSMTVAELKEVANEMGLTYSSSIKKADLIALIEGQA